MNEKAPEPLCRARRSLEGLASFITVGDWIWDDEITE